MEFNNKKHVYLSSALKEEAEKRMHGIRGAIRSSLYESMTSVNIPPEIIIQFAEIFASKVDFLTDCRTGDNFSVLWESYFDKHGNILKELQTHIIPLHIQEIPSHTEEVPPHLGIDYAAPTGTPVSSIGNGTVTFARTKGGLGNAVIIKHPNGYISWYGHLSKIARGVRKGTRVKKGQVIGYVGSTGLSTGPHLDFRIQRNGKFLNFLALKMPQSYPLPDNYLPQFNEIKDLLADRMKSLKETETVFKGTNLSEDRKE